MKPSGMFNLEGKVALVTGSSTGLGKEMIMSLGALGAQVVVNYQNNQARGEETFQLFKDRGYEGILARGSAVVKEDVERMVAEAEKAFGRGVDIAVINATPDQPQKPIEEYDWDFYQQMLDFFVKSPFLVCRAVLPHMKAQRWGRIINIGSEVFQRGVPNFTAYVAAKGAQCGFTRSLATEVAPWEITVNTVSPGWIPVERHENDPQDLKDGYLAGLPMKRWGVPKEVADLVAFLSTEEASYISGQNICVNGAHTVA